MIHQPDIDPPPAWHQRLQDMGPDRTWTPGRWCSVHHVVHVGNHGECPESGRGKDGDHGKVN